ncbi:uncharacterized protein RHOBADRAFT_55190 [Rhodotorula graminis WP1]|uniref:Mitochondrial PGP phosphatase n=1 Tax=Rhodotorula graminis (strain WP1) TaxID=578459 RepID=A0A0N8PZW4_RHOGW|nr:uncharacterized protein RHOBADRAFT_55190 [Rhodotorula graminis WP1]KPV73453.1 hypothetical protein RHOBADRAFT_55190 [Rhodotorula graminis WP1]
MTNWPGIQATLVALVRPHILQPALRVPSIASLDLAKLRNDAQVDAVVIDKDNCIAQPRSDSLADDPNLRRAWQDLVDTFGPANVLVVSNSAGDSRKDPLTIQAQALSRNLGVPVLVHPSPKPAHACVHQVAAHFLASRDHLARPPAHDDHVGLSTTTAQVGQVVFSPLARARLASSPSPSSFQQHAPSPADALPHRRKRTRILVIGDRLATDMVLAHRLSALTLPLALPSSASSPSSSILGLLRRRTTRRTLGAPGDVIEAVPILTTHLWAREGAGTTLVRWLERAALWGLGGRGARRRAAARRCREHGEDEVDWSRFVKGYAAPGLAPPSASLPETSPSAPAAPVAARLPSPSLPSLTTLAALPSRLQAATLALPSRLSRLPSLFLAHLQRLPSHLLVVARRTAHRALGALERRLPSYLARLGADDGLLARLVGIYARPGTLAPSPTGALRPIGRGEVVDPAARDSVRRAGGALERFVDRVGDGVEGVWAEARRRAERGASVGKSAASGVEQVKRWVVRRGGQGPAAAGPVKVEDKRA